MCSRSMLVTTARIGESLRKERSLSSASATKYSRLADARIGAHGVNASANDDGGIEPPAARTAATIEVVVVLPCMPAMAMPYFRRISSASISARGITGMCCAWAAATSGLSRATAELVTTTSAPDRFSARCPSKVMAPMAGETMRDGRGLQVGAGNLVAEVEQHFGDAAHADATDAHEMNTLNFGEHGSVASCQ